MSVGRRRGLLAWLCSAMLAQAWAAPDDNLRLVLPEWVEDGAFVPLTLHLEQATPPLSIRLLRDGDEAPRIADIELADWQPPLRLSTRVRLPQSQAVIALVEDGQGRRWRAEQAVMVLGSSCRTPLANGLPMGLPQAGLRATEAGSELRSLLPHPMETGLRPDGAGGYLPRHLLQQFEIRQDTRRLLVLKPQAGLAANPYLHVYLRPPAAALTLRWTDDDGRQAALLLEPAAQDP